MRKILFVFLFVGFVIISSLSFYLKTQIDSARNDISNLTSVVNLQEVKITETGGANSVTVTTTLVYQ